MIAIIPARGGSKGLPKKNVKPLCGKPLIAYTIKAAMEAECIDKVIVTTDSQEIADIAVKYGAEVPFMRPKELADDNAKAKDVYIHAVDLLSKQLGEKIEKFMVLLPTAPFRTARHIEEAYRVFEEKKATTVISMQEADTPISWYYSMLEDGTIRNAGFDSGLCLNNRQDNKVYYRPNGAIYILDYELLLNKGTYYCENTFCYLMNRLDSIDIDSLEDFMFAEYLIQNKH